MTGSRDEQAAVLVVGGGITGLSMAFFLARQGIRPLLIERHPSTAIMPQARAFNPRSMEIYRAFGLEAEIRDHTSMLVDFPEMIGAETLAGAERFRIDMLAEVRPPMDLSPTDWAMIDQDELELVIRAHAESAGADVRFGAELVSVDPAADGVRAVLREPDSGAEYRVRADYLVAADGHRAGVRTRLGIGAGQPGVLGQSMHFIFDADLSAVLRERRFVLAYLDQPTKGTILAPLRKFGRWMLGVPYHPELGERPADFTERRCAELVRGAVGVADLELGLVPPVPGWPQLASSVNIGGWVADRYRSGRVFFVGDAAHVVPPTGSYGASTGIADAHNLAWKLAAVLEGRATDALLDSYEDERRPVAQVTLRTALQLLHSRHEGTAEDLKKVDDITMILGYRYESAAIHTEPGTPDTPLADPREPTGRPGLRAPHVWLDRAETRLSTLDLCTGAFTLIAGPDGAEWVSAAGSLDIPVHTLRIGVDLHDRDDRFLSSYGISGSGATLIRPDGFIAWRAETMPQHPASELRKILNTLLAPVPAVHAHGDRTG